MRVERRGTGPNVLLIAGLGDPAEAWRFQLDGLADRYRLIAYDNRGAGRNPLTAGPFSVATMADDAAALLRALGVPAAHGAGFSGASAIAQELALRNPGLVRSLVLDSTWARSDAFFRAAVNFWRLLADAALGERAFLEASICGSTTPVRTGMARWGRSLKRCWRSRISRPPRPFSAGSTPSPPPPGGCPRSLRRRSCRPGGLDMITRLLAASPGRSGPPRRAAGPLRGRLKRYQDGRLPITHRQASRQPEVIRNALCQGDL